MRQNAFQEQTNTSYHSLFHSKILDLVSVSKLCLKIFIYVLERGREGERVGDINVWLPPMHPLLGIWPTTQACACHRLGIEPVPLWFAGWQSIQ